MTTNYTADQLVFLDESSKDERVVLWRYGRAPSKLYTMSLSTEESGIVSFLPFCWMVTRP